MKSILTLSFILLAITCLSVQSVQSDKTKSDFGSLSWLEGKWTRSNIINPGRTSFEAWTKTGEYEFTGLGVTLQGSDTVFVERLKIVIEGNEILYVADIPGNPKPVHFAFTKIGPNLFICENPKHDFPKKISYRLEGYTLKAQTSGDGKVQEFVFVKSRN
jgi:Domain of unknown function (DUF6265)